MRKFVIPNLNKEVQLLPISSVVLSSQSIDMKEALFNAKDKLHTQDINPLVRKGQKLIPSVTRVFSRAKPMYTYLQAYQQDAEAAQPVVGIVSFYRGKDKIFETPPLAAASVQANRLKTIGWNNRLSLDPLTPGEYTCQVTILNPGGQKAAFWRAQIMVVP